MSLLNAESAENQPQPQLDDNLEAQDEIYHYQFNVKMSCGGCSGAVGRALDKIPEVVKSKIDLPTQQVGVWTTLPYDDVLAAIKKTGKEVKEGNVLPVLPDDLTD